MNQNHRLVSFEALLRSRPQAWVRLRGSSMHPQLKGTVRFYVHPYGTVVVTEIYGLPVSSDPCASPILGFHIHAGDSCTGNSEDPFADAKMHYNPKDCEHPYHAGDLPPLFVVNGCALSACLTDRFTVHEIIGKTVIVHASPDDFSTQPSGNVGGKIACGEICGYARKRG